MDYSSYAKKLAEVFSDPNTGELFRKEIYRALSERLISLKNLRKKITASGVPESTKTHVDQMIDLYPGPEGILINFMGDEEIEAAAKKTGDDIGQLDIEDTIEREEAEDETDLPSIDLLTSVVNCVRSNGDDSLKLAGEEIILKALNGFTRRECLAIIGYYNAVEVFSKQGRDDKTAELRIPDALVGLVSAVRSVAVASDIEDINACMKLVALAKESNDPAVREAAFNRLADPKKITADELNAFGAANPTEQPGASNPSLPENSISTQSGSSESPETLNWTAPTPFRDPEKANDPVTAVTLD